MKYHGSIFLVLMLVICDLTMCAQIAGTWHGFLQLGANRLPVVFHIDDSTMDSPAQNAFGIPVEVKVNSDTLAVDVAAIGARYRGVKNKGIINGTFSQQGVVLNLDLKEGDYVPPRPQTPQPPYPYYVEEVEFYNPTDSAKLSGTLTVPLMANIVGRSKIPAVIIVSGSGLQNRDGEIFNHKPYHVLADYLANAGIASLRYDDRGFAESTGIVTGATTFTFAGDAEAAIDYLRSQQLPFKSVGVIGHSEGGTIAFILAQKGKPDFIISLAGTAVKGDSILLRQNEMVLKDAGVAKEIVSDYITAFGRLLDALKIDGKCDVNSITADLAAITPEMEQNLQSIADTWKPWLDNFVKFDPESAISETYCPVFALNGSNDRQVDSKQNLGAIERWLPHNSASVVKEYPGLNHLFQHAPTGNVAEYGSIEETISPEVLADIVAWIKGL